MSPELQPMTVQYYCHLSPSVTCDQYSARPLEGDLVLILRFQPIPPFIFLYSPFNHLMKKIRILSYKLHSCFFFLCPFKLV